MFMMPIGCYLIREKKKRTIFFVRSRVCNVYTFAIYLQNPGLALIGNDKESFLCNITKVMRDIFCFFFLKNDQTIMNFEGTSRKISENHLKVVPENDAIKHLIVEKF